MSGAVDVLAAEMDARTIYDIASIRAKADGGSREDIDFLAIALRNHEFVAAVAELIEADIEVDEAEAEYAKHPGNGSALWLKNAKARRAAALARVQGGAK